MFGAALHTVPMTFSDEDLAFLRQARFGKLPDQVPPEDRVELIEVDPRRDLPDPEPESLNPATAG